MRSPEVLLKVVFQWRFNVSVRVLKLSYFGVFEVFSVVFVFEQYGRIHCVFGVFGVFHKSSGKTLFLACFRRVIHVKTSVRNHTFCKHVKHTKNTKNTTFRGVSMRTCSDHPVQSFPLRAVAHTFLKK